MDDSQGAIEAGRDLFEGAPIGYATLNLQGELVEANSSLHALLDHVAHGLAGRRLASFMSERDAADFRRHLVDAQSSDGPVSCRVALYGADGTAHAVVLRSVADPQHDEAPVKTVITDLSEKHRTALLLSALGTILDAVTDALVVFDEANEIVSANAATSTMFQISPDLLVGTRLERLIPEVARITDPQQRGAPPGGAMLTGRRADGTEFPVAVILTPGATRAAILRDMTSQIQQDEVHAETLRRFNAIAEHIDQVFYIFDIANRRTVYMSPAFEKVYGLPTSRVEEDYRAFLESVHPDDLPRVVEAMQRTFMSSTPFDEEYRIVRRDGGVEIVRDRAFVGADGRRLTGFVEIVTKERKARDELRHALKLESVGALASGVAHDFNNVLMGISGCAHIAMNRLGDEHPARASVEMVMQAAQRGARLTTQLLGFAREGRTSPTPIGVDEALTRSGEWLRRIIGEHIELFVRAGAPDCAVLIDASELDQILMNLAANARDAMPTGGTLVMSTRPAYPPGDQDARALLLTVADSGNGMDEATSARAFEPFFTTKLEGRGTGLGLSTTATIIEGLGGQIAVHSRLGEGTTFEIWLPLADSTQLDSGELDPARAPSPSKTIMVVEDDRLVRMTVVAYLNSLGHRTITASGRAKAIGLCAAGEEFDMLLTDVVMPGGLGSDLARSLRRDRPDLEVLMMSAHPKSELIRNGQLDDDYGFVQKPFDQAALAAAIAKVERGARNRP